MNCRFVTELGQDFIPAQGHHYLIGCVDQENIHFIHPQTGEVKTKAIDCTLARRMADERKETFDPSIGFDNVMPSTFDLYLESYVMTDRQNQDIDHDSVLRSLSGLAGLDARVYRYDGTESTRFTSVAKYVA